MYIAVLQNGSTTTASELYPLLVSLHGKRVSDVAYIAGPIGAEAANYLAGAFPKAKVVSSRQIAPQRENVLSVPDLPIGEQISSPVVIGVMSTCGGIGKTTTSLLLSQVLREMGDTLLVDKGPQIGLTSYLLYKGQSRIVQMHSGTTKLWIALGEYGTGSRIPPEVAGVLMGVSYVVVDNGNDPEKAIGDRMVVVTDVGFRGINAVSQVIGYLPGKKYVIAVSPVRARHSGDVRNTVALLQQQGNISGQVFALNPIPVDPWLKEPQAILNVYAAIASDRSVRDTLMSIKKALEA